MDESVTNPHPKTTVPRRKMIAELRQGHSEGPGGSRAPERQRSRVPGKSAQCFHPPKRGTFTYARM